MSITIENLSFTYGKKTPNSTLALDNINLTVNEGDFLGIIGHTGSGKSTLVKSVLGLIETHSGHLHMGDGLKKREIGYLPQQNEAQKDFPASVYEVVLSGCLASKKGVFFSKAQKRLAEESMEKLDITELKGRCYRELSGGQQQRVLLARALCATKKLLLLDEPVTGLDPVVTADFYRIIKKINREYGITVIMVSHDLYSAVNYATHILHMKRDGSFFGTVGEYLSSDVYKAFSGGERNA